MLHVIAQPRALENSSRLSVPQFPPLYGRIIKPSDRAVGEYTSYTSKCWEAEAGVFLSSGQPGLQSEFLDSQGYTEIPYLEKPKPKPKPKTKPQKQTNKQTKNQKRTTKQNKTKQNKTKQKV